LCGGFQSCFWTSQLFDRYRKSETAIISENPVIALDYSDGLTHKQKKNVIGLCEAAVQVIFPSLPVSLPSGANASRFQSVAPSNTHESRVPHRDRIEQTRRTLWPDR
jgi:hypothetical protein